MFHSRAKLKAPSMLDLVMMFLREKMCTDVTVSVKLFDSAFKMNNIGDIHLTIGIPLFL